MTTHLSIEIFHPTGTVSQHGLGNQPLLLGYGQHNDIQLDDPQAGDPQLYIEIGADNRLTVTAAAAQLVTFVNGKELVFGTPTDLAFGDVLTFGDYMLIAVPDAVGVEPVQTGPAAIEVQEPAPVAVVSNTSLPTNAVENSEPEDQASVTYYEGIPEDISDQVIVASAPNRIARVEVENNCNYEVSVTNGGDLVATFHIEVDGLPKDWVTIKPPVRNLPEGEKGTFVIAVMPPRHPDSEARDHHFAIRITSPEHPDRQAVLGATLSIDPFYNYQVSDLAPQNVTVTYREKLGDVGVGILNLGNAPVIYRLEGEDTKQELVFEFETGSRDETGNAVYTSQKDIEIAPNQEKFIKMHVSPVKHPVFGLGAGKHDYNLKVTPAGTGQAERAIVGEAKIKPLLGPLFAIAMMLIFAAGTAFAIMPRVRTFDIVATNGNVVPQASDDQAYAPNTIGGRLFAPLPQEAIPTGFALEVPSGETLTISWDVWVPFGKVIIEPIGEMETKKGSIEVPALDTTNYKLVVESPLKALSPAIGERTQQTQIVVLPDMPIIELSADRTNVFFDDEIVLSWNIRQADEASLVINGSAETLEPSDYATGRKFKIRETTTFTIIAKNRYTSESGIQKTVTVSASAEPPAPLPLPEIANFSVSPLRITAGQTVTLSWDVANVNSITINPLGELPPKGELKQAPTGNTDYVLIADTGEASVNQLRQVIVDPAPTPTPQPGTPVIAAFDGDAEVIVGSSANLKWEVNVDGAGTITDVRIEGGSLDTGGLDPNGSISTVVTERTLYVLTAFNGDLRASKTFEVIANNPLPVLNALDPVSSDKVGASSLPVKLVGENFLETSTVTFNGTVVPASFVSASELIAIVPGDQLAVASSGEFKVTNPAPGGGESGGQLFNLVNPSPELSSLSPNVVQVDSAGQSVTLSGSNFVKGATVNWHGEPLPAAFISSSQLEVVLPEALLASDTDDGNNCGSDECRNVTVTNPSPGGGTSGTVQFKMSAVNPKPQITEFCRSTDSTCSVVTGTTTTTDGSVSTIQLTDVTNGVDNADATLQAEGISFEIKGEGFLPETTFMLAGQILKVDGTPTETSATVKFPVEYNDNAATYGLTAINPLPGGGASTNVVNLKVENPTFPIFDASNVLIETTQLLIAGQKDAATITVRPPAGEELVCSIPIVLHWQSAKFGESPVQIPPTAGTCTAGASGSVQFSVPPNYLEESGTYTAWTVQASQPSATKDFSVQNFDLQIFSGTPCTAANRVAHAGSAEAITNLLPDITLGATEKYYVSIDEVPTASREQFAVRNVNMRAGAANFADFDGAGQSTKTVTAGQSASNCVPVDIHAVGYSGNEYASFELSAKVEDTTSSPPVETFNTFVKRTVFVRVIPPAPTFTSLDIRDPNNQVTPATTPPTQVQVGSTHPLVRDLVGYTFTIEGSGFVNATVTKVKCPNTSGGTAIYATVSAIDSSATPQTITGTLPTNCFASDLQKLTVENNDGISPALTIEATIGVKNIPVPRVDKTELLDGATVEFASDGTAAGTTGAIALTATGSPALTLKLTGANFSSMPVIATCADGSTTATSTSSSATTASIPLPVDCITQDNTALALQFAFGGAAGTLKIPRSTHSIDAYQLGKLVIKDGTNELFDSTKTDANNAGVPLITAASGSADGLTFTISGAGLSGTKVRCPNAAVTTVISPTGNGPITGTLPANCLTANNQKLTLEVPTTPVTTEQTAAIKAAAPTITAVKISTTTNEELSPGGIGVPLWSSATPAGNSAAVKYEITGTNIPAGATVKCGDGTAATSKTVAADGLTITGQISANCITSANKALTVEMISGGLALTTPNVTTLPAPNVTSVVGTIDLSAQAGTDTTGGGTPVPATAYSVTIKGTNFIGKSDDATVTIKCPDGTTSVAVKTPLATNFTDTKIVTQDLPATCITAANKKLTLTFSYEGLTIANVETTVVPTQP